MTANDEEFSRKSEKYRKNYLAAAKGLHGEAKDIPNLPPKSIKVRRSKKIGTEAAIQIKLVSWIKYEGLLVHSIPNHGRRSYWTGQKEVTMGLLAGVADLFLVEPGQGYHGYYIELKTPGNKPTELQYDFAKKVSARGYKWAWFDKFELAQQSIREYLNLTE